MGAPAVSGAIDDGEATVGNGDGWSRPPGVARAAHAVAASATIKVVQIRGALLAVSTRGPIGH